MTLVRNQPLAEEITQNTFYRAMTSKKTFAQKSGELTWLCSIAKHLAADEYRKTGKTAELDEAAAVSGGQNPADAVEDKETALQIHLILHDLPEPYKEVFQLRVFCLGSCALPSGSQEGENKTKAPRKCEHFRGNHCFHDTVS